MYTNENCKETNNTRTKDQWIRIPPPRPPAENNKQTKNSRGTNNASEVWLSPLFKYTPK